MISRFFGAVDIGASGGRVIGAVIDDGQVTLRTVHRFPNGPVRRDTELRWDITAIFEQVLVGLELLGKEFPQVESIGIDTWGVDYALLDAECRLLGDPVSYRDHRTRAVIDQVHHSIDPPELYRINGLQFLPFTTLYQLAAERAGSLWDRAAYVVLLPDLLSYWLTGILGTELTNASTTGLLDATTGTWSPKILDVLGVPVEMLPPLRRPGTVLGPLSETAATRTGLSPSVAVTTVTSHDTASAVVAVPATSRPFAYISSGTWSLVGTELEGPILSKEAEDANFTNERGVDDHIRFLRNVGGLWLLQESMRSWAVRDRSRELALMLREAAALPSGGPLIDVDDPDLIAPDNMPERIQIAARLLGQSAPPTPAATMRCILDSLACAYSKTLDQLVALCGLDTDTIHIVGGGSQNALLCQLTADFASKTVEAGPTEATALGNAIVQARAFGALPSDLSEVRRSLAEVEPPVRYVPGNR